MKKILCFLLCLLITFCMSINVFADEIEMPDEPRIINNNGVGKQLVDSIIISPVTPIAVLILILIMVIKEIRKCIQPGEIITTAKDEETLTETEKFEEAEKIVNGPKPSIPGLDFQSPVSSPTEEVVIDPKEIPWELENAPDATDDEE